MSVLHFGFLRNFATIVLEKPEIAAGCVVFFLTTPFLPQLNHHSYHFLDGLNVIQIEKANTTK